MIRKRASSTATTWRPGAGAQRQAGGLGVRVFGGGDPVIVFMHGIAGSQAFFGSAYDALGRSATVVVPDLLGFGSSMQPDGAGQQSFGVDDHIFALNRCLRELHLTHRPVLLVVTCWSTERSGIGAAPPAARHTAPGGCTLTCDSRCQTHITEPKPLRLWSGSMRAEGQPLSRR